MTVWPKKATHTTWVGSFSWNSQDDLVNWQSIQSKTVLSIDYWPRKFSQPNIPSKNNLMEFDFCYNIIFKSYWQILLKGTLRFALHPSTHLSVWQISFSHFLTMTSGKSSSKFVPVHWFLLLLIYVPILFGLVLFLLYFLGQLLHVRLMDLSFSIFVGDCPPGTKRQVGETGCDGCPRGQYQSQPYKTTCEVCSGNTYTRNVNSTKVSDCESKFIEIGFSTFKQSWIRILSF